MRASSVIVTIVALLFTSAAHCPAAEGNPLSEEFLRGFMAGTYDLIGRKPDSTTTYSGRVTLRVDGETLQATRTIDGNTTKAILRFDTVGGTDRIPVVRMRFTLDGTEYEATYQWRSDLDNYPRFTGIVYRPDNQTKKPGLEALFPIHE
jgi:hypothetical protein